MGGLAGVRSSGAITNSYYNKETSGQNDTGKGIPKTTAQMYEQASYNQWDFFTVWKIDEGNGYPKFRTSEEKQPIPFEGGSGNGGSGTLEDPYQIADCIQLGYAGFVPDKHFVLTNDIDCSETKNLPDDQGFTPIGRNPYIPFSGTFDGKNYTIFDLYINRPLEGIVGLFGYVKSGAVSNIGLENVEINGYEHIGGLAGINDSSVITNCHSSGSVISVNGYAGGLVGLNNNSSSVTNSYSSASAHGNESGGLVGSNDNSSSISNSYASGVVTGGGGCWRLSRKQ